MWNKIKRWFCRAMSPVKTVSVTNGFGITTNYYCHRTHNVLGSGINIGVS